jgi:hypothetical protein
MLARWQLSMIKSGMNGCPRKLNSLSANNFLSKENLTHRWAPWRCKRLTLNETIKHNVLTSTSALKEAPLKFQVVRWTFHVRSRVFKMSSWRLWNKSWDTNVSQLVGLIQCDILSWRYIFCHTSSVHYFERKYKDKNPDWTWHLSIWASARERQEKSQHRNEIVYRTHAVVS